MSTDKPFPVEPGYEYWQRMDGAPLKTDEVFSHISSTGAVWSLVSNVPSLYLSSWFRRKLPVPQPKSEWVRFSERLPNNGQPVFFGSRGSYDERVRFYVAGSPHPTSFTHWHPATLPTGYPPEPTQEEKDREAAKEWRSSNGWNGNAVDLELAFVAGIQLGRKSK